jgi:urea transport system substrate-binding protein
MLKHLLRAAIEARLKAHDAPGRLVDGSACEPVQEPHDPLETQDLPAGAAEEQRALDFLQPSARPGSLGRLGHYEVLEVLGRGGFGIVFRAFDEVLQRVVAVKVLSAPMDAASPARKRFLREARSSAPIRHENVVQLYAIEELPLPYIVMEYIPGQTLQQRLNRTGPLDVPEVLRIGAQVARGLAAAHAIGMIHGDIKPGNILLEKGVEQRAKLTDFGLARPADDPSILLAGTPMYMSPEQIRGDAIDHRADLFSLGSVLYVMVSGRLPFCATDTPAVLQRVNEDTPQPVREIIPETPQWLRDIIAKLHAKNPDDRFQTAAEVANLLSLHLAHRQPRDPQTRERATDRSGKRRFSSPSRLLVALSAVLVLVGTLGVYLLLHHRADVPAGADARPIRVGILHSQTGTMGTSESSAIDATLLGIEEINADGGLLGRTIEPVVVDGMSDSPTYAREAERLITAGKVCTIFGCWTSSSRKAVTPIVEKYDHLLIYPMQYEGLEQSPQVVYNGALPNQQVTPAVRWSFDHLGKRFFIVGSDYIWPRATSEVIRDVVAEWGGAIVGEEYLPMESVDVETVVQKIRQTKAEVILEMVAGDSKVAYYRALRRAGVTADKVPSISFSSPQPGLAARDVAGDYAAWNYFESIDSPANRAFVARFRARFGPQRSLSDPLEASYLGVHLWAQAVRAAGNDDVAAIRRALAGQRFQAPEGEVQVDPETQHLWKTVRIARITATGAAEIVWSSGAPVRPVVFPASRSREQWDRFLKDFTSACAWRVGNYAALGRVK